MLLSPGLTYAHLIFPHATLPSSCRPGPHLTHFPIFRMPANAAAAARATAAARVVAPVVVPATGAAAGKAPYGFSSWHGMQLHSRALASWPVLFWGGRHGLLRGLAISGLCSVQAVLARKVLLGMHIEVPARAAALAAPSTTSPFPLP
jgi:hypothetical protein